MNTTKRSEMTRTSLWIALGAGVGLTFGLLFAGGAGIALGLTFGAGIGAAIGLALVAKSPRS